jgi:FADH2 O2-dependent halogenase
VLDRIGLSTVLIDSATHPRFAIGESSTPIAGMVIRDLATRYDLPRLLPLAKYRSAEESYPSIVMGKKRGFSYFRHKPNQEFKSDSAHKNELLVAASLDDEHSDAHWLRSDLDAFLANEATAAGIPLLDATHITDIVVGSDWSLSGQRDDESVHVKAKFVVDASGAAGVLLRHLGVQDCARELQTRSRAAYAHFKGVARWQETLSANGHSIDDFPFACDDAALHHVLDEGWIWWLRFRNDVTSVGLVVREAKGRSNSKQLTQNDWEQTIAGYPSLANSLRQARAVAPEQGLIFTNRLQRLARQGAGPNWAALPNTIGFIDPLHSTGIAQTLCGVRRLAHILATTWEGEEMPTLLTRYDRTVRAELQFIDLLVDGCYHSLGAFELFTSYSMLYFAAAISYEHRFAKGKVDPMDAFLCADDARLVDIVKAAHQKLVSIPRDSADRSITDAFAEDVRRWIEPYNIAGLCDPSVNNMYRYTAAPA